MGQNQLKIIKIVEDNKKNKNTFLLSTFRDLNIYKLANRRT